MALKSTVVRTELQISDVDRNYYATHALTLAQHPSETDERLLVRVLAFAMFADERLEFGRGLSADDEPALWRKDLTGVIEHWIEVGQPDEAQLRRACGRARNVAVITYSGRSADIWWQKIAPAAARLRNLQVIDFGPAVTSEFAGVLGQHRQLHCMIQDGHQQWYAGDRVIEVTPVFRQGVEPA